jgi:uncharacterized membrane protein YagU involved in acid resistance
MPDSQQTKSVWKTIGKAGLVAGTLDLSFASIQFYLNTDKSPVLVFRYIASAIFGRNMAYADNALMPVLGVIFHYVIAFIFTIFFFWIYPKLKFLSFNRFLTALLFGCFVWVVMNLLVVPLTNVRGLPFDPHHIDWEKTITAALILILAIGMPLSFFAYHYYNRLQKTKPK